MRTHSRVHAHRGFVITTVREGEAKVWDPRCPRDPALVVTESIGHAVAWVDLYRAGRVEIEYVG